MPNQMYQLCYGSYTIVGMLWQQQLFYGSNSHAMTAAIAHMAAPSMLWQQQLRFYSSSYAFTAGAMLWHQQHLCYGSSSSYTTADMLWQHQPFCGSSCSYSIQQQVCYGSSATLWQLKSAHLKTIQIYIQFFV